MSGSLSGERAPLTPPRVVFVIASEAERRGYSSALSALPAQSLGNAPQLIETLPAHEHVWRGWVRIDVTAGRVVVHGSGSLSGKRPPSRPAHAVAGRELAHVVGVGLGLPCGVLSAPAGEVIEEALDLVEWPVESPYEEIAGMAEAPATEISSMVVILLELGLAPAQLTLLSFRFT